MQKCFYQVGVGMVGLTAAAFFISATALSAQEQSNQRKDVDAAGEPGSIQAIDFDRDIRPILSDRCYFCHGPDASNRQAGLRLDESESAAAVIEAGEPEQSELIRRIESEDPAEQMPPPESKLTLDDHERALIRAWIQQGASWKEHWSFRPREEVAVPEIKQNGELLGPIDAFIAEQQAARGLRFSPLANKETLIRRVTFDLTGLPPTLEEIDKFLADNSPDAYEKLVDRLLASPAYGQRMASYWLDVARYSDTYGYQVDRGREVWRWRDWLIQAYNENKPHDDFIVEQLAGDLLPDATENQILATTFNRLHPQKVEGGSVEEEFRVEYVADRVQTTATAFMGLTLECARCHDHKFDPISQREYYQLFAFFNNIDEAGLYAFFNNSVPTPTLMLPRDDQREKLRLLSADVDRLERVEGKLDFDPGPPPESVLPPTNAIETVDFAAADLGRNEKSTDAWDRPAVTLTGDDPVNLKQGNFHRYDPFSITLSMKTPDVKTRAVVFHRSRAWTDAGSRGYQLLIEDGKLSAALVHFWPGNAIAVRTVEPIPVDQWLNVAVVYDGSSRASGLSIWLDGQPQQVEVVRDHLTKKITGSTDHLVIGERFRDRGFTGGQVSTFQVFDRQLPALEIRAISEQVKPSSEPTAATEEDWHQYLLLTASANQIDHRRELHQARKAFCEQLDGVQEIMVMKEMDQPRPTFVLNRGQYDQPGDAVTMKIPEVLTPWRDQWPRNRLGLSRWLVAPEHPLTARVAVNQFWQLIFGDGLVRTPEDFGRQGMLPTHPELLDWLANDFVAHHWDVKRLIKQLVMSRTYRQSSEAAAELLKHDPDNRWLARSPAYRLPAEMIRDNALAVSGLLDDQIGGPSVRPYELQESFKPMSPTDDALYRRSLYTYWKRTGPAPVMLALDASKRDVCRVKRERTSSPIQALALFNGTQYVEAAQALAWRLMDSHGREQETILVDMFRNLTGRFPDPQEQEILLELYEQQRQRFEDDPDAAVEYLKVAKFGRQLLRETIIPPARHRWAAWSLVAQTLMNHDQCVTKR